MDCVRKVLKEAAAVEGADTIDFGSYVCPDGPGRCLPLRTRDGMHIDPDKAPAALSWLVDQVLDVTDTKTPAGGGGPTTTTTRPGAGPVKSAQGGGSPTLGN